MNLINWIFSQRKILKIDKLAFSETVNGLNIIKVHINMCDSFAVNECKSLYICNVIINQRNDLKCCEIDKAYLFKYLIIKVIVEIKKSHIGGKKLFKYLFPILFLIFPLMD